MYGDTLSNQLPYIQSLIEGLEIGWKFINIGIDYILLANFGFLLEVYGIEVDLDPTIFVSCSVVNITMPVIN